MSRGQQHSVRVEGTDISFSVKKGETILRAAARQKVAFPSLCNVGECGSCRCSLQKGQIQLKTDVSRHISDEQLSQGDILACQSTLLSSIDLHVPTLSPANSNNPEEPGKIAASIASIVPLSSDIVELTLALEQPLTYHAGQFALLFVPAHPVLASEPRSYSLAGGELTKDAETVQFHIRKVPGGTFTDWLFSEDRSGEKLLLEGPFGSFGWSAPESKVLLIAGGSGYAPINALLEACRDMGAVDATVVYGARTQADVYCADHVEALQEWWKGALHFTPILSEEPEYSDWSGLRGFVHQHLDGAVQELSGHSVYMCGPPPMIDACLGELGQRIEPHNIHYDKFLDRSHISTE